MKVVVWLLILLPSTGWAHYSPPLEFSCQALLANEFGRPPNDGRRGLVTQNIPLTVDSLITGYSRGLFPWGTNLAGFGRWYRPPERGVLDLNEVHISDFDRRYIRRAERAGELKVTFDRDFRGVMEACASVERFQTDPLTGVRKPDGAWISDEFIEAYGKLHDIGLAHSVEVWRGDRLVGGLYGVFINGVFTGESMFFYEPNSTKLAFKALINRLREGGHKFIDTQVALGLALKWGAKLIPRAEFEERLAQAQQQNLKF